LEEPATPMLVPVVALAWPWTAYSPGVVTLTIVEVPLVFISPRTTSPSTPARTTSGCPSAATASAAVPPTAPAITARRVRGVVSSIVRTAPF